MFLVSIKQTHLGADCFPLFIFFAPFLPSLTLSPVFLASPSPLSLSRQTKAANETLTPSLMIEFISRAQ